ncbi:RHS repeat-associated core domain-containing protein [Pseudomonas moorei]|uniref:RHS repeat-associated core domain-containing protein n=1 Tax=Pseudomonas moorei TaxID=395599 RepID=UPI001FF47223|nr:RHS repeat-associated core domain-containing protein [Pseudomonas moorei]
MSVSSLKTLRRYHYDPLDRLSGVGLLADDSTQRFYQENHLTTELGHQTQRSILRHEAQPLAQQQSEAGVTENTLMVTDQAHSLLHTLSRSNSRRFAYTAYGHHPADRALGRLPGFTGEYPDFITGHYPLGQGERFFNPVLMRFNSPDELSPFDERAGINSYAYCEGDPINFIDPTGNMKFAMIMNHGRPVRPVRPTVIVKSPLVITRKTTSVITKHSSQAALSPKPSALLDQPAPPTSGLNSNTSVNDYQLVPVPSLKTTVRHSPSTSNPSYASKQYRYLANDAVTYDILVNDPNFRPMAPQKLMEKYYSDKRALESASHRTHSANDITRLKAKYNRSVVRIKSHVIRYSNANGNRR